MNKKMKKITNAAMGMMITAAFILTNCACAPPAAEEVPKLVWYIPGDMQPDLDEVLKKANEIIIPQIGADLEIKFIQTDKYTDTMNMKMGVQEKFDLCFTGYINSYRQAVMNGGLLKIDEYIENMPLLKETIPDYAWHGAKVEDGIYAVPNMQFIAYCKAAIVDRKLAEKYNLDPEKINHITDMEPFFEQIKQNEPDYYPYSPSWGVSGLYKEDENGAPYAFLDEIFMTQNENGEYEFLPSIETDTCREAIYKTYEWYQKGYIREDIALVKSGEGEKKSAVRLAMYKPGQEGESLAKGEDIVVIKLNDAQIGNSAGTTAMTGIGKWSQNPEKAIKLIELVNTDKELFNILAFGIEGKHYKKTGENRIELTPKEESGYFINSAWKFGNQFLAYILPGQPDDVWEETQRINDNAKRSKYSDFKLSTEGIEDEINRIDTVFAQYEVINYGSQNPDEYLAEFSEKLREAGVEKVCEEVKRQFLEYLKTKEQ